GARAGRAGAVVAPADVMRRAWRSLGQRRSRLLASWRGARVVPRLRELTARRLPPSKEFAGPDIGSSALRVARRSVQGLLHLVDIYDLRHQSSQASASRNWPAGTRLQSSSSRLRSAQQ